MHRIIFSGAQGTGKTTVLNYFKEKGNNVITEVVRRLKESGIKINKDGDEKGQTKIFKTYKSLLEEISVTGYISDRGLFDVVAYTKYLADHGQVSQEFLQKQIKDLKKFVNSNPDIVYCYFPIEFPVEDDGVRDTDEEFRKEIDENIQQLYTIVGVSAFVIKGDVETRQQKLTRIMNWLHEGMALYMDLT